MADLHVDSLKYRIETNAMVSYLNPSPLVVENEVFEGLLDDGLLTCRMKQHFTSVDVARKATEIQLQAWEIYTVLTIGQPYEIHFKYEDCHVIDRTHCGTVVVVPQAMTAYCHLSANVRVTRAEYPDMPKSFSVSPDVQTLWDRYRNYLQGREPLQSMAYFCLTVFENLAGVRKEKREKACEIFNVDPAVLGKLGALTSNHGDKLTGRKAGGMSTPLTGNEKIWIESVVRKMIIRLGEYKPGQALVEIVMTDFIPI